MSSVEAVHFIHKSINTYPTLEDYYSNLSLFITLAIAFSIVLLVLNTSIFCITACQLKKSIAKNLLKHSIFLCAMYPIISLAAVLTILLPQSWLVCHTVMHLSFTVAAVVFQKILFRYVGSEQNYLKISDEAVQINTPPCCCCCICLPSVIPSQAKIDILKYMIWQMPFVQGIIMIVLIGCYFKEGDLYDELTWYLLPFIIISILSGVWSMHITVHMITKVHAEYRLRKKMLCIQFIMLFCKLQYLLMHNLMNDLEMGEGYPMTNSIYKQAIINLLILVEMAMVSLLANNAYKFPLVELVS